VEIKLGPGVCKTQPFPSDATDFIQFRGIRQETLGLYVMGELAYEDDLKVKRTARFCRRYDYRVKRFLTVADPDYEATE